MLSHADEYPIHQTPEPIAYSGGDRNFYDRFFFNGYSKSQPLFFAAALGFYPQLNVKDAAFAVIIDGVQHNLRASAHLAMERMNMRIGPIEAVVQSPMVKVQLKVEDNAEGIAADLVFTGACELIEEPRFVHRVGPRLQFDYTRMTQNGSWSGWLEVRGARYDLAAGDVIGTRDRSWGVRPIGARDPQPVVDAAAPQFYWLWAPIHCDDKTLLFAVNEYTNGKRWHTNALVSPHGAVLGGTAGGEQVNRFQDLVLDYEMESGSRHHAATKAKLSDPNANEFYSVEFAPAYKFYMSGLGYMHPKWGHGSYHGELEVAYDAIDLGKVDQSDPQSWHIQAVCDVSVSDQGGGSHKGVGVLEQLVLGAHEQSGLVSNADVAS